MFCKQNHEKTGFQKSFENQWSEEEGNLYLTFRDYLGRKEFINFKLESIASDGSISQKLDSISLMLNQMSKKQKAAFSKI